MFVEVAQRRLLTLDQVAERCQVSRRTVERLVAREDLPAVRVGGSVRVDPVELDHWLYSEAPGVPPRPDAPVERRGPDEVAPAVEPRRHAGQEEA